MLGLMCAKCRVGQAQRGPTRKRFRLLVGLRCACPTLLLLFGCAFICGCGNQGPERATVSGTVTFNGRPVQLGFIRFVPSRETPAPVSGAEIHDGRYAVTAWGGVPVGTHKIEVLAHRAGQQGEAAPSPSGFLQTGGQQYIPEKYNTKSELGITVPVGSGKITKNLDLTD